MEIYNKLVVTLTLYMLHEFAGKVDPQVALLAAEHAPEMFLLSRRNKVLYSISVMQYAVVLGKNHFC